MPRIIEDRLIFRILEMQRLIGFLSRIRLKPADADVAIISLSKMKHVLSVGNFWWSHLTSISINELNVPLRNKNRAIFRTHDTIESILNKNIRIENQNKTLISLCNNLKKLKQ